MTTSLSLQPCQPFLSSSLTPFFVFLSLLPYLLLPLFTLFYSLFYSSSSSLLPLFPPSLPFYLLPFLSLPLLPCPSPSSLFLSLSPSHSSQESDAQAVSSEVGQLDLLEAGPAEVGSEQAEQVRLFLAGEHDIMQKVFAGQEEEEERGTQVEIEVRTFCRMETVHGQSCGGGLGAIDYHHMSNSR